jgi:MtrB/PioB family decaheme-associated outer membrane protein
MKNRSNRFVVRGSVVAVQAALLALAAVSPARAADSSDPATQQLTAPTNSVEVGAGYVTQDNVKFGQYNGLYNKGPYGIFNMDVSGGGAYDSGDPTRWRIFGNNLGLDSRDVTAEFARQGVFKIDFGFDQLHQIKSDTYQTPYMGGGSDALTLPPTWIKPYVPQTGSSNLNFRSLSPTTGLAPALVNGVVTPPTPAQQAIVNNIIATDLPDFHNVDLSTKRTTYKGGFTYDIDRNWEFKVSGQHQTKDGLKPLGSVSSQVREFAAILPYPVDESTDQYNVSLTYNVPKGFMQVAYYGSIYKNDIKSLTYQDVNDPTKTATLSSAPSNDFHQFLLTGGYNFTSTTKLVMDASYGRTTQDDTYLTTGQNNQYPLGLPQSSLNGKVVTEAFNARFTSRPVEKLNFVANYKYDDRHNETPVNIYYFQDANESASGNSPFNAALGLAPNTLGSNTNIYANRPYSKKLNQFNADADYAIAKGQNIKAGYEYQQIDRTCDGSWINCADAPRTRENTLSAEWRANVIENLSGRILYAYSERRVDYDPNAFLSLVPMANVVPSGGATISAYQYLQQTGLTGFGPVAGYPTTPLTGDAAIFSPNNNILPQSLYASRNNINELVGMMRYNMADRNRDKVRASLNWDATDKLSLNAGLDYNKDDYNNSVYGLKSSENWALNFDANFAASSDLVIDGFYTHEDTKSQSAGISYGSNSNTAFVGQAGNTIVSGGCFSTVQGKNNNAKIDPCSNWSTDMRDKADTFGVSFRQKNLMAGKLEVLGDLTYTDARTDIGVSGGSYVNSPFAIGASAGPALPAGVPAVYFIPAAGMPTVSTKTIDVRLSAQYSFDKHSALRFLYWYEHLNSSDYYFDGVQFGTLTNVVPTNEQPYHENVNVIGISYIYRWQ